VQPNVNEPLEQGVVRMLWRGVSPGRARGRRADIGAAVY